MAFKAKASSYPPGFRKEAPKSGFAVKKGDFTELDPYNIHNTADESEQIWTLLQTEAGRSALGAQIV